MDKTQKIILSAYAVMIGGALANYAYQTIKTKRLCKNVDEKTRREILRIAAAEKIMRARIAKGLYKDRSFNAIFEDFEFYQIVADE